MCAHTLPRPTTECHWETGNEFKQKALASDSRTQRNETAEPGELCVQSERKTYCCEQFICQEMFKEDEICIHADMHDKFTNESVVGILVDC